MGEGKMTVVSGDYDLIARVRQADLSALGELYDKYHLQVFHTALTITRNREAAEDVLQECFLKLHTHAYHLDGTAPIAPWLYRVTINLSYTWITRDANRWTSLEGVIDRIDRLVAPLRGTPEYRLEVRDLQTSIQEAIDALPFNQRVVVILFYLGGLSLKEISHILDCPVGTTKSRLHYGREALRRQLASGDETHTTPTLEVRYELNA
jgi:RNA polymerase sigma-70 factor (ECF subfamily)